MNLASFVDELEKIALQRSVQEWRAAQVPSNRVHSRVHPAYYAVPAKP
jgi:hypothetical protein